ncbi:hypothetical protein G5714_014450 [Onychostoma macrolepis]|uniref:Uncharacterized protein n=1 Tax=Onychostoma macrolepis TaxID=369639 RepID=A0A7J6CCU4_9TELE|nr:hypothetical protein G5714_014450 [Onychostoma macrolepis]
MVLQLLPHLQKLDGFTLQAGVFITPSDVQQSLHLPENTTYNSWSISKQPAVDVEQPNSGLAVLFVLLYDLNLQYQEEVACTPATEPFRRFLDINPECASKTKKGKVT